MTDLKNSTCKPCEGGVARYTPDEARALLAQLDSRWRLDTDSAALRLELRFKDFYSTMSFVNALAHIANVEDHHPDLEVGYNYCNVTYSTHAISGLSENDFICAAKIDALVG